ncbi:MAG: hypothetical protein HYY44_03280 [Deltaproteobacteria bacterium]|nr:hypothetical protein [Deltaproteobacteria bacterium]MBI4373933.1 hypothetical protein [Deltaproteobacteria bacterium]
MKTTLVINDLFFRRIKAIAAKKRKTLSEVVESLLRLGLAQEGQTGRTSLSKLPEYKAGRCRVEISDRDALYQVMEKK